MTLEGTLLVVTSMSVMCDASLVVTSLGWDHPLGCDDYAWWVVKTIILRFTVNSHGIAFSKGYGPIVSRQKALISTLTFYHSERRSALNSYGTSFYVKSV